MLNGLWGDSFDRARSPFGIRLGLRAADGTPIPAEPNSLSRAFPAATTRLVVLLHGLGESERCWLSADDSDLPSALESDGFTVLSVRYNSGLSVNENGSDLAALLESVATSWPVAVGSIDLVGHSMGGLVAGAAIGAARTAEHRWVHLTRHLVAIASPHLGSPIEKGVQFISDGLGVFAETRPLQGFLQQRSVGIKNLRHGVKDDGAEFGDIQLHYVAATITTDSNHPIGSLIGDLVVRVGSATGRGRSQPLASDVFVVGGRNHASLLRDADVRSQIRTWLASSRSARTSP